MIDSVMSRARIDPIGGFVVFLGVLTAARLAGVIATPVELHGDESQYWTWSNTLAWGYYSKPPLIAWVIAATTAVFGEAEWAVRLAAPLAHAGAAMFLALLARDLAGPRAGVWAGVTYATIPAVWLSSGVISTDAVLLPCVAAALFFANRLRAGGRWRDAAALGLSVGLGFLAKYAMIYVVAGLGLLVILDADTRRALVSGRGVLVAAIAGAIVAPNLAWNAANQFQTVAHTADNANWGGQLFRPGMLAKFVGDQFGVFGPISFGLLIWALVRWPSWDAPTRRSAGFLAAFIAPALLAVSAQAFISRANANWAALSYAGGSVLVAIWAVRFARERVLGAAVSLHIVFGVLFTAAGLSYAVIDSVGLSNAYKRARGWDATAQAIDRTYDAGWNGAAYAAVAFDNRLIFHSMEYYARHEPMPLRMWIRYAQAINHAEASAPLTVEDGAPVLVVSERPVELAKIAADFATLAPVDEIVIDLGGGIERRLSLFAGEGFAPLARDEAYEARWRE